jgi:hypothetical protein
MKFARFRESTDSDNRFRPGCHPPYFDSLASLFLSSIILSTALARDIPVSLAATGKIPLDPFSAQFIFLRPKYGFSIDGSASSPGPVGALRMFQGIVRGPGEEREVARDSRSTA